MCDMVFWVVFDMFVRFWCVGWSFMSTFFWMVIFCSFVSCRRVCEICPVMLESVSFSIFRLVIWSWLVRIERSLIVVCGDFWIKWRKLVWWTINSLVACVVVMFVEWGWLSSSDILLKKLFLFRIERMILWPFLLIMFILIWLLWMMKRLFFFFLVMMIILFFGKVCSRVIWERVSSLFSDNFLKSGMCLSSLLCTDFFWLWYYCGEVL